jgi:hypothetical protein
MEATTRQPQNNRSRAKLSRIHQKFHQADDRIIRKYLIEYDHDQHKSFSAYYDGVVKFGEAVVGAVLLFNLSAASRLAGVALLIDGAVMGVFIELRRTVMTARAEKILANRHPKPKEAYSDPNILPNLPRTGYLADGILSARKCLIDIDRNVELFRVALQVPVVKVFESRHGNASAEDRADYAFRYRQKHYRFRIVIDNLRKPMVEAIETIQEAMKYLRGMPDSEAKRNVLKELQDRVNQLMPFGDMVHHHHGSKDFYRKDLLDLSNQLNTLAGPAVAVRSSSNPTNGGGR